MQTALCEVDRAAVFIVKEGVPEECHLNWFPVSPLTSFPFVPRTVQTSQEKQTYLFTFPLAVLKRYLSL